MLRELTEKEQGELNFWIDHIHGLGCIRESGKPYLKQWSDGARARLEYYFSAIPSQVPMENVTWVDVGTGPYSLLLDAPTTVTKVMIDPLMKFYFQYDLVPNVANDGKHIFLEGFSENLPLADESADMVFCTNALDHVEDPWKALAELARILKVGGHLILETDTGGVTDHMHPHAFSQDDIEDHVSALHLERMLGKPGQREKRRPGAQLYYGFYKKSPETRGLFPKAPLQAGCYRPMLVLEGLHGYNIVRYRDRISDRYYGIRQDDGAFYYETFQQGGYPKSFEGSSLEEVSAAIRKLYSA